LRLILDAHVSGKRVGQSPRDAGHDVRAADSETGFEGMEDPDLLALAAQEGRTLVTFNVKDFSRIVGEWAGEGRPHAGIILVPGSIRHHEFGVVIAGTQRALEGTKQRDWVDRVEWMRRR